MLLISTNYRNVVLVDAAIKAAVSENSLPSGSAGFTESAVPART